MWCLSELLSHKRVSIACAAQTRSLSPHPSHHPTSAHAVYPVSSLIHYYCRRLPYTSLSPTYYSLHHHHHHQSLIIHHPHSLHYHYQCLFTPLPPSLLLVLGVVVLEALHASSRSSLPLPQRRPDCLWPARPGQQHSLRRTADRRSTHTLSPKHTCSNTTLTLALLYKQSHAKFAPSVPAYTRRKANPTTLDIAHVTSTSSTQPAPPLASTLITHPELDVGTAYYPSPDN